jgi:hypothetical protein
MFHVRYVCHRQLSLLLLRYVYYMNRCLHDGVRKFIEQSSAELFKKIEKQPIPHFTGSNFRTYEQ